MAPLRLREGFQKLEDKHFLLDIWQRLLRYKEFGNMTYHLSSRQSSRVETQYSGLKQNLLESDLFKIQPLIERLVCVDLQWACRR